MKGIQHIEVFNRTTKFEFDLYRNITVIRGDSGTGKTTLYNMIADYARLREESGVNLSSLKPCVVLEPNVDYQYQLSTCRNSIVFIDEGARYLSSPSFAEAVRDSDNYYVIFNREGLPNLPYSVDEIYEIVTSGRYHSLRKFYPSGELHRYTSNLPRTTEDFQVLLSEDIGAGQEFFRALLGQTKVRCEAAGGKTLIFQWLKEHSAESTLVIADGAAFGAEIDKVMQLCRQYSGRMQLCLPESFEWLILKSGIIPENRSEIAEILQNPSAYIESGDYFSWEQFFTAELIRRTTGTQLKYSKKRINKAYLQGSNPRRILSEILGKIPEEK